MITRAQMMVNQIYQHQIDRFYLMYLLFLEYGEVSNAEICLECSISNNDVDNHIKDYRKTGFNLKKEKKLDDARKAFSSAAEGGDPISQYELAKLYWDDKKKFCTLLESASEKLVQAQVDLYRFYLENSQYENAFRSLVCVLTSMEGMKRKLTIEGIPKVSGKFRECNRYSRFHIVTNEFGKRLSIKLPLLADFLYQSTLELIDPQEKKHLYNLGVVSAHVKSIISLADYEDSVVNDVKIKKMIQEGREGNEKVSSELIQLAMKGHIPTITVLFDQSLSGKIGSLPYVIQIIKEASVSSPIVMYALGLIYTRVEEKYADAERIIVELAPIVENMANQGNSLAMFYMGWLCEKGYLFYHKALNWYGKAASSGSVLALYNLGKLYTSGICLGIRKSDTDPEQGHYCYTKCAELGYIPAQESLALLALTKKDYLSAMIWLEKSMLLGHIPAFLERKAYLVEGELKEHLMALAKRLCNKAGVSIEVEQWAQGLMEKCDIGSDKKAQHAVPAFHKAFPMIKIQKALRERAISDKNQEVDLSQTQIVLQDLPKKEEGKQPRKRDFEVSSDLENQETLYKKIFLMKDIIYENPRAVSESIFDALTNFGGKNVSKPKTQMVTENYGKGKAFFNEELPSSVYVKESSPAKSSLVTLTQAAFLDEKLVSQAEYFAQTGFAFATLREAAEVGTVHILGGLPSTEEESILDSALDWMGLSYPSQDILEDFSLFL